jgi:hypothetical protein
MTETTEVNYPKPATVNYHIIATADQILAIAHLVDILLKHAGLGDKKELWRNGYHELALTLAASTTTALTARNRTEENQ